MKINYVIATYNGKCRRNHKYPPINDVLKCHLDKLFKLKNNISQITIMKATSDNYYENYYDIDDIIKKFEIPVKIIECENFGYSNGQWLKAYELFKDEFDFYLFLEDDYCCNLDNFDEILLYCYSKKFPNNIGLLCSIVQGSKNYKENEDYPIHYEGCVFINKNTLKQLYNNSKWNSNPRKYLDLIDNTIDPFYNWENLRQLYLGGYYQVTFSYLFSLSGIEHEDYIDIKYYNKVLQFPYWNDICNDIIGGSIYFYNKDKIIRENYSLEDIYNSPIIPIQLKDLEGIKINCKLISINSINSAYYGANNKWINVTNILTSKIYNNYLNIIINNDLFGDPIENHVKQLRLKYFKHKKEYEHIVTENDTLKINFDNV